MQDSVLNHPICTLIVLSLSHLCPSATRQSLLLGMEEDRKRDRRLEIDLLLQEQQTKERLAFQARLGSDVRAVVARTIATGSIIVHFHQSGSIVSDMLIMYPREM